MVIIRLRCYFTIYEILRQLGSASDIFHQRLQIKYAAVGGISACPDTKFLAGFIRDEKAVTGQRSAVAAVVAVVGRKPLPGDKPGKLQGKSGIDILFNRGGHVRIPHHGKIKAVASGRFIQSQRIPAMRPVVWKFIAAPATESEGQFQFLNYIRFNQLGHIPAVISNRQFLFNLILSDKIIPVSVRIQDLLEGNDLGVIYNLEIGNRKFRIDKLDIQTVPLLLEPVFAVYPKLYPIMCSTIITL